METITHKNYLKENELSSAETFFVVWDKVGNKFFKLAKSDLWATQELSTVTSKELAKRRVKVYR